VQAVRRDMRSQLASPCAESGIPAGAAHPLLRWDLVTELHIRSQRMLLAPWRRVPVATGDQTLPLQVAAKSHCTTEPRHETSGRLTGLVQIGQAYRSCADRLVCLRPQDARTRLIAWPDWAGRDRALLSERRRDRLKHEVVRGRRSRLMYNNCMQKKICETPDCGNRVRFDDVLRFIRQMDKELAAAGSHGINPRVGGRAIPRPFYCSACLDSMGIAA